MAVTQRVEVERPPPPPRDLIVLDERQRPDYGAVMAVQLEPQLAQLVDSLDARQLDRYPVRRHPRIIARCQTGRRPTGSTRRSIHDRGGAAPPRRRRAWRMRGGARTFAHVSRSRDCVTGARRRGSSVTNAAGKRQPLPVERAASLRKPNGPCRNPREAQSYLRCQSRNACSRTSRVSSAIASSCRDPTVRMVARICST